MIGDRAIGPKCPVYVVAEIGINHNGDITLAKEMIQAAAQAGADAVKFQNYRTEDFLPDRAQTYTYISQGKEVTEPQYDMFKRCELTRKDVLELAECAKSYNVDFHSTPTNTQGIQDLIAAGVGVLKNGSDYLPNLPLIKAMGETGLPTVLSTGMAVMSDIEDAVNAFRETGNEKLVLLHCTSAYPTPDEDVNVQRVKTLEQTFECLSGFSDHSEGHTAAVLSLAYDACWIEKHFTTDRNLPGPDHRFSMDPDELNLLVKSVRAAEKQIGTPQIDTSASEQENRELYRLSCVASKNLETGSIIDPEALSYKRPGSGIPPKQAEQLYGLKLKKDVQAGHIFSFEDFEQAAND